MRRVTCVVLVTIMIIVAPLCAVKAAAASTQPGVISIVGYELWNASATERIATINPDDIIVIRVSLNDSRPELENTHVPNITVNTASFLAKEHNLNGGDATIVNGGTYSQYTLDFTVQYLGAGNLFAFDIAYNGGTVSLPIDKISITLNQCVERVAAVVEESEPEQEIITRGTGFAMKSVSYGADHIEAGSTFTLTGILMATNGDIVVNNTNITFTLPTDLSIAGGSSVIYIGTLAPNQEVNIECDLFVSATVSDGSIPITLNIVGVSAKDGNAITGSVTMSILFYQPSRLSVAGIEMPEALYVSEKVEYAGLTVNLANMGKSAAYNVRASITGQNVKGEQESVFFGTIEPGALETITINLAATTIGSIRGTILIYYESANGTENVVEYPYELTAKRKPTEQQETSLPEYPDFVNDNGDLVPGWIWPIISICGTILILTGYNFHAKKSAGRDS